MCNEERKEYFEISDKFIELPLRTNPMYFMVSYVCGCADVL